MKGILSIVLFTLFIQVTVGMVFLQAIMYGKEAYEQKVWSVIALISIFIGMIFSLLHLSIPLHSLLDTNNIFTSWKSAETLHLGIFAGLFLLYVLLQSRFWLNLTALAGIALVFAMSHVYSTETILHWQSLIDFTSFIITSLLLGTVTLLPVQIIVSERDELQSLVELMTSALPLILGTAIAIRIVSIVYKFSGNLNGLLIFSICLLCLAGFLLICIFIKVNQGVKKNSDALTPSFNHKLLLLLLVALVYTSEFISHIMFFKLHTGMGM